MNITELRELQSQGAYDFNSTLRSVEINPTELCNRTCVFCPRSDPKLYKNAKRHIDPNLCKLIGQQLENFTGRIGFVGFGEPLLHPNIVECIANIRTACPTAQWIEINTNGDILTRELVLELESAGCTNITISMYDKDNTDYFTEMFLGTTIELIVRHCYDNIAGLVNRINITSKDGDQLQLNRQCYIPFYKMFIDWNGDYLLCQQDWSRTTKRHRYNILRMPIKDFWTKELFDYRLDLLKGIRSLDPCSKCDIDGTKYGKESFRVFYDRFITE